MLSNFQSPVVLFLPNPLSGLPAVRIVVVPTGVQLYDSQIKVTLSETLIPSKNVPPLLVVFSLIYVLYLWVFFFFFWLFIHAYVYTFRERTENSTWYLSFEYCRTSDALQLKSHIFRWCSRTRFSNSSDRNCPYVPCSRFRLDFKWHLIFQCKQLVETVKSVIYCKRMHFDICALVVRRKTQVFFKYNRVFRYRCVS